MYSQRSENIVNKSQTFNKRKKHCRGGKNRCFTLSSPLLREACVGGMNSEIHVKYSTMGCTFINLMVDANFLIKEESASPPYTESIHN